MTMTLLTVELWFNDLYDLCKDVHYAKEVVLGGGGLGGCLAVI